MGPALADEAILLPFKIPDRFRRRPWGYGGHVASLAMTSMKHVLSFPQRVSRPGDASAMSLFKKEGAGKTGYRLIPAVRVQQKARGRTTGSAANRPSLRNGLNGLYVLSPGTGCFAPVACGSSSATLGISTGMPGPHDFAVASICSSARRSRCKPMRPPLPALHVS
jgi:hypothetical protein